MRSKYVRGSITSAAPTPTVTPAPRGDLRAASVEEIIAVVEDVWPLRVAAAGERRRGLRLLLADLAEHGSGSWQQRWDRSDYADGAAALPRPGDLRLGPALRALLCLRVIQPSLSGMRAVVMLDYPRAFAVAQADPQLDRLLAHLAATPVPAPRRRAAAFDVACALTVFGIVLADLDPAGLLHFSWECRRLGVGSYCRGRTSVFSGQLAWQALREVGQFGPDCPPTLVAAAMRGPLTVTELVDQYPVSDPGMRQMFIDYLTRRAAGLDHSSLTNLTRWLVDTFWGGIQTLLPGQCDLRLPGGVYDQWRASIALRRDGRPRLSVDPILLSVRSFYLDLHTWSVAEPRWAQWVAPCPIGAQDLAGSGRRHRRTRERSAARTRHRQPLLPALVDALTARLTHLRRLLSAVDTLTHGQAVQVDGRAYTRVHTRVDQQAEAAGERRRRVRDAAGQVTNLALAENDAFWDWAVVETLRLSGLRIEELLELTQLSIRRYERPNGETIALLVVAPSKTDIERVIPMSAQLFAVIAAVIRRHNDTDGQVPMVARYDTHERVHTPPMPHLFQRRRGGLPTVFSAASVLHRLQRYCAKLAATDTRFVDVTFTPHDFRRLFATDLVNNGLPIHIGAALLGHLNLETTRGYVAVFEEDLIRHYQAFLHRRRQLRPAEEYRPATDDEWAQFQAHFDKRKVELGNCARPYGTGCAHEHACLRCPMLNVHPDMLPRLEAVEADLLHRRARAESEQWLGEVEGIDITLGHLANKRDQTRRLATLTTGPVLLGMPTNAGRTERS